MAGEVGLQSDVYLDGAAKPRTLHLKTLRRQWQIIALQVVATIALIGIDPHPSYLAINMRRRHHPHPGTYIPCAIYPIHPSISILISHVIVYPHLALLFVDLISNVSEAIRLVGSMTA